MRVLEHRQARGRASVLCVLRQNDGQFCMHRQPAHGQVTFSKVPTCVHKSTHNVTASLSLQQYMSITAVQNEL